MQDRRSFLVQVGALSACAGCSDENSAFYPYRPKEGEQTVGAMPDLASAPEDGGVVEARDLLDGTCASPAPLDAETLPVGGLLSILETNTYLLRDERGYYAVAGICTHAGCAVRLNTQAKTYDCPCHGSRYELNGQVRNGPAGNPLPRRPLCRLPSGRLAIDYSQLTQADDRVP